MRNRYTQAALKGKSERDRAIRRRRGVTSFRNGKTIKYFKEEGKVLGIRKKFNI